MTNLALVPSALGLLFAVSLPVQSQGYTGSPLTANRRVETSSDGRNFHVVSEGKFFRDSAGRIRMDETIPAGDGSLSRRRIRIYLPARPDSVLLLDLDPATRTGASHFLAVGLWASSPARLQRHIPPEDRSKNRTCAFASFSGGLHFLRRELLWCDPAAGAGVTISSPGLVPSERESYSHIVPGEPHPALFVAPQGYQVAPVGPPVTFRFLPSPPPIAPGISPWLLNPRFTPGQPCDEFRLAGAENVVWNCPERPGRVLRVKRTG